MVIIIYPLIIVGVNEYCFDLANNPIFDKNLIGKSAYDLYTPETAAIVDRHIKQVIEFAKPLSFEEELIDLLSLEKRYYVSSRLPLFEGNQVVGIVGCIVEITAQKEADRLRAENETQHILKYLNFKCDLITNEQFEKYLDIIFKGK